MARRKKKKVNHELSFKALALQLTGSRGPVTFVSRLVPRPPLAGYFRAAHRPSPHPLTPRRVSAPPSPSSVCRSINSRVSKRRGRWGGGLPWRGSQTVGRGGGRLPPPRVLNGRIDRERRIKGQTSSCAFEIFQARCLLFVPPTKYPECTVVPNSYHLSTTVSCAISALLYSYLPAGAA